jgi:hypothetical protein
MRRACIAHLGRLLNISPERLPAETGPAFADFAMVLSLIPDLPRWTAEEKSALRAIISAKCAQNELRYLRLLQNHAKLRAAILRLGS